MIETIPNGLEEIEKLYGNCMQPEFETNNVVSFELPYSLLYDGQKVTHSRCHKLAVDNFIKLFQLIKERGLEDQVQNYGGIYQVRTKRGMNHPSTHCWAIAIDLEPAKFPLGSTDRFSDEVVQCMHDVGFFYGGDFENRKDPMHAQLCSGY